MRPKTSTRIFAGRVVNIIGGEQYVNSSFMKGDIAIWVMEVMRAGVGGAVMVQ